MRTSKRRDPSTRLPGWWREGSPSPCESRPGCSACACDAPVRFGQALEDPVSEEPRPSLNRETSRQHTPALLFVATFRAGYTSVEAVRFPGSPHGVPTAPVRVARDLCWAIGGQTAPGGSPFTLDVEQQRKFRPLLKAHHLPVNRLALGQRLQHPLLDGSALGATTQDVRPAAILRDDQGDVADRRRGPGSTEAGTTDWSGLGRGRRLGFLLGHGELPNFSMARISGNPPRPPSG